VAPEGATLRTPPAALESRPVVANVAPPPAPVPFAAKQQALAAYGGRPLAPAQEQQIRQSSPSLASPRSTMYRPAAVAPAGGGLKPAHEGLAAATAVSGAAAQGYVPRTVAASRSVTTPPPAAGTNGTVASNGTPPRSTVPHPPDRVAPVATRVPSSTGNQNLSPGASTNSGAAVGGANGSANGNANGSANGTVNGDKPAGTPEAATKPGATPGAANGGTTAQSNGAPKPAKKPHPAKKPPPPKPRDEPKGDKHWARIRSTH
jgi:hypothetical protein